MNKSISELNRDIKHSNMLAIKQYAMDHHVPIITDDGLSLLFMLIDLIKPINILEIGTAIGYSALAMSLHDKAVQIDTIERNDSMYQEAVKNLENSSCKSQINIIYGDALELDMGLLKENYNLIFIDAAKAQYIKFFEKYEPLLAADGIIVSDNLIFHGLVDGESESLSKNLRSLVNKIKDYRVWLANHPNYQTTFLNIGDGMSVSKKVKR